MTSLIQKAHFVVDLALEHGEPSVSPMKLQKLLYYVYAWGLVNDKVLVEGSFCKWTYGPVQKEVWEHFNNLGFKGASAKIPGGISENPFGSDVDIADLVVGSYAPFSAITLSTMTHKEDPWRKTADNDRISPAVIKEYYSKLPFAKNFPVSDGPYYPVTGGTYNAFTMDMSAEEAAYFGVYKSFMEYKRYLDRARGEISSALTSGLLG